MEEQVAQRKSKRRPRGVCSVCHFYWTIRQDGTVQRHDTFGWSSGYCEGSLKKPIGIDATLAPRPKEGTE